jgi:hypothetical protein
MNESRAHIPPVACARAPEVMRLDLPQIQARRQPIKEYLAGGPAPNSHDLLVAGTAVEANLLFCHFFPTPTRSMAGAILQKMASRMRLNVSFWRIVLKNSPVEAEGVR